MGYVLKDVLRGGGLIAAGTIVAVVALVVLFVLGIFLHILGVILSLLFFVVLLFLSIWLVGFLYRKIREMYRK